MARMGDPVKIVVANSLGRLETGQELILFPSRWDSAVPGEAPFAYYPYELGYLSALLKRETDFGVHMIDGNFELYDPDEYAAELIREDADVIVTECSALTYPGMTKAVMRAKQETGCEAWLTGPIATMERPRATGDGWDACFRGEYEAAVLATLKGETAAPGYIDVDWLPFPEDDDISRLDYTEASNPILPGMVQLYPTRGCPLACTFCVVPIYYGGHGSSHKSHRKRDPHKVCDEIEYLADKYGDMFKGCFFNEETHNADPVWLVEFANTIVERGLNGFAYDAMCGYWNYTEEMVEAVAKAGYKQIRFGVESTAEQVGRAIHKTMHLDRLELFMGWCRNNGVGCYGTFQIGAPGSSENTDRQTLRDLRRWNETGLMQRWQVSTSTPQPGTPFYQQAKDEGWLLTEDLSKYDGLRAVVSYPDYPADRIEAVRALA